VAEKSGLVIRSECVGVWLYCGSVLVKDLRDKKSTKIDYRLQ